MATEAHKLRFVRCPKCYELLVEYPSIPVYKCGGCSTVLRAKSRAVPVVQVRSDSDAQNSFPSSLKGSPQDSKAISSDERKIASSMDQPREVAADGTTSSPIKSTDSSEDSVEERAVAVVENVTLDQHQEEETCTFIDENTQNPGITVKETHGKGTETDSGSKLIGELENLDTGENAGRGEVDKVDTRSLNEKTELEEGDHMNEGMHIESHEALIEELERSLSFSSDDEYFSDEAETSGLSDALRHQMGSHRFRLGGQINDSSRSDPHGRLIEELEMSFSDVEEPPEQHAVGVDRINGNKHDKDLQTLDTESASPCEESIPSLDNGHLNPEQSLYQGNRPIDNCNEGKEDIEDDKNSANDVHGNAHDTHPQTSSLNNTHPCEESIPPVENGHLESEETFLQKNKPFDSGNQGKEYIEGNNNTGNEHIVVVNENEVSEERCHEKKHSKDLHPANAEIVYPCERSSSSTDEIDMNFQQTILPNGPTADGTQENKEACMDDGNMISYIHGNKNVLFTDEDAAEKVQGNEDAAFNCTEENEENHVEVDNQANYIHGEENLAVADDHIAEKVVKDQQDKDQQSQEAESGHVKFEVICKQEDLIADSTKQEEEGDMGDDNMINTIQENSAAVASFPSWSNKRNQWKLSSFNKNKEAPCKYRARQLRQGLSLDAKDFKSIQNFIEPQMDGTSSSLSSGSPCQGDLVHETSNRFNNIIRHERLKKMDELRDQLSRLSSQKGMDEKYRKRGLEHKQQVNNYDVEQHLQNADVDSVPDSCALESYYGYERPPKYQPPNCLSPTHTYPRYDFGHAQTRIPHDCDMWEFNSYYQSSYAESTVLDHMSSYKELKRVVRKHILRPLSGASPFSICSSCFNLIQMPSDMYISKAMVGKMQCGRCSKVLVLSFPAAYCAEGNISVDVMQQCSKPAGSMIANNKDSTSHSAECLRGPVSINEDYGASFTRSFSTQAGASLAAAQSGKKVSVSALHRLMGYDSASQLLRHSRALDDGYDSFESMVPVSSRVSRRKKM